MLPGKGLSASKNRARSFYSGNRSFNLIVILCVLSCAAIPRVAHSLSRREALDNCRMTVAVNT